MYTHVKFNIRISKFLLKFRFLSPERIASDNNCRYIRDIPNAGFA